MGEKPPPLSCERVDRRAVDRADMAGERRFIGQQRLGRGQVAREQEQNGDPSQRQYAHRHYGPAAPFIRPPAGGFRSEEHTSELQYLMRTSYAVFCLKNNTYYSDLNSSSIVVQYPSLFINMTHIS